MSRKLVFVVVFLAVLPVLMVCGEGPGRRSAEKCSARRRCRNCKRSRRMSTIRLPVRMTTSRKKQNRLKPQVDAPKRKCS